MFRALLNTKEARRRELSIDIVKSMEPVERLALQWVLFNDKALADTKNLHRMHVLSYEELCRDPRNVMVKIFEWIGMDWNSQSDEFLANSTNRENKHYYSVFKSSESSADKWRKELDVATQEKICAVAQDSVMWKLCNLVR